MNCKVSAILMTCISSFKSRMTRGQRKELPSPWRNFYLSLETLRKSTLHRINYLQLFSIKVFFCKIWESNRVWKQRSRLCTLGSISFLVVTQFWLSFQCSQLRLVCDSRRGSLSWARCFPVVVKAAKTQSRWVKCSDCRVSTGPSGLLLSQFLFSKGLFQNVSLLLA